MDELILKALREVLVGDGVPGVAWYASGGGMFRSGPFPSVYAARRAFRYTALMQKKIGREVPEDFQCWPEPETE